IEPYFISLFVCGVLLLCYFFFSSRRRHTRSKRDWSSDVCSSDLRPVDILVATPGRAQDLVNQKKLSLSDATLTALDEADQMADMGFLPQVKKLLALTPDNAQRLLFSATLDGDVNKLVSRFMHDPVTHSTAPVQASVDTMKHYVFFVGEREDRNKVVLRIAAREGKTIMFMRTKHG